MSDRPVTMRDAVFNRIYELALKDRNVIFITADMGAPSLDKFKTGLPKNFINAGISEQGMITVATGLALSGKKIFLYSIIPFVTERCIELVKVDISFMKLPVTLIGVGSGFSYNTLGPTHHGVFDVSLMRTLPDMTIFNCTDSAMADRITESAYKLPGPSYIRMDRENLPSLYSAQEDFSKGYSKLRSGKDFCIIASGVLVRRALDVADELARHSINAGVIDLYRLKPIDRRMLEEIAKETGKIVTLEEHVKAGGMGSALGEMILDQDLDLKLKVLGIDDRFIPVYGRRDFIQQQTGLDKESITHTILRWS